MAFTLENHGFPPEEIRRRSKEALAKVHLEGLEDRKVTTLSGGQCQRLVVAAVLAEEPDVLASMNRHPPSIRKASVNFMKWSAS